MKRLEEPVKRSLLSRNGKSLPLTPEGQIFHPQTLRILDALDRALITSSSQSSKSDRGSY